MARSSSWAAPRAGDPRLEALLARDHRLPPLRQFVGHATQRGVHDERLAGGLAILAVHVRA